MVAIFFFVSGFGFYTWASRIPTIQQELHLNEAQLGAVCCHVCHLGHSLSPDPRCRA